MERGFGFITGIVVLGIMMVLSLGQRVQAGEAMKVSASILPQKYFIEKIAGPLVDVTVMVPPGANPATYEPRPRQMFQLAGSVVYFSIGVPFEEVWLKKFSDVNPEMKIVHTDEGIEKITMETLQHHHENEDHMGEIRDPHIWLSPSLVTIQARTILKGLKEIDPVNRELYEANCADFIRELETLDRRIGDLLKHEGEGTRFMVYHPSWGYFAKAYGLEQVPIEIEGKDPTPRELKHLIQLGRELEVRILFTQSQFSDRSARIVAKAIGARTVPVDPLDPHWAENLVRVAETINQALR